MKKIISLIALMMSVVILATGVPVLANDVTEKRDENFVYYREGNMKGPWIIIDYHGKSKNVKIPYKYRKNKIEAVYLNDQYYNNDNSAMEKLDKIESIYLPATIEWVGISGLKSLKKVTISKKNEFLKADGKFILSKNGKNLLSAFNVKYPKIPKTVRNIGGEVFAYSNVRKVTFSKNIKKLGIYMFNGCNRLKEVTIESKTLPKLERGTFDYMKKGVKFYVKNKTVAKDLKENLDGKGTNADIYVKNKLVFENVK